MASREQIIHHGDTETLRIARNAKIAKIAEIEALSRRERSGSLLPKSRSGARDLIANI